MDGYQPTPEEIEMMLMGRPQPIVPRDSLSEQLDVEDLVIDMECSLRAKKYDKEHKVFLDDIGKPMINDTGFQRLKAMFKAVLKKNTLLSNLEENTINEICIEFADNITWLIAEKRQEYEIDNSDRDIIVDTITRTLYLTLKRAQDGIERRSAREQMNIQEIRRSDDGQKKGLRGLIPGL